MAGVSVPSMTALDYPSASDLLYVAKGGTADRKATVSQLQPGVFFPTALTSAGVQAAIDACVQAGGGAVYLGNATYICTTTITLHPSYVSLIGHRATFDCTTGADNMVCLLVQSTTTAGTSTQYGHHTNKIEGIRFIGKGNTTTQVGMQWYTPVNGPDYKTSMNYYNLYFYNFYYGIECKDCSFINHMFGIEIGSCATGYRETVGAAGNAGENNNMHGCSIYNGTVRCIDLRGQVSTLYAFGCSFDYTPEFAYVEGYLEMHSCWLEKGSSTNNKLISADLNGKVCMYGGAFALGTPTSSYIFYSWSGAGAWFNIFNVNAVPSTTYTLANDTSRVVGILGQSTDNQYSMQFRGKAGDITAAGTNQGTATALDYNAIIYVGTVAASTGVLLKPFTPGMSQKITNAGANTLTIYANGSETINGSASITLAAGKTCEIHCPVTAGASFAMVGA